MAPPTSIWPGGCQYALQGISSEQYFYGLGAYFVPSAAFLSRDDAIATRRSDGGSAIGIYPLDRFRRIELSAGVYNFRETFANEELQLQSDQYQLVAVRHDSVPEWLVHALRYPLHTGNDGFPRIRPGSRQQRHGRMGVRAWNGGVPVKAGRSKLMPGTTSGSWKTACWHSEAGPSRAGAEFPDFIFFGGQGDMRGYDYLHFLGHKAFHGNVELRFPLVEAMATPIGILGGIRGDILLQLRRSGSRRPALEHLGP